MTIKIIATLVVSVLILVAGFFLVVIPNPDTNTTATTTPETAQSMQVKIALLDTTGNGTGKPRGCDTVTMATRVVPKSTTPLHAALDALFAEPDGTQPSAAYNFIARTRNTLKFDRATIIEGTAQIYLTGSLSGLSGVCDDPRAAIQIEETALQFTTVKKVQLYLNGEVTTLTPNQKGEM
jgi:hypothetical protein